MIYDNFNNIELYKGLSPDLYEGLTFLKNANPDLATGVYQLNPRVKAIVSEYETKAINENGFEAHRQYIDIQALLQGEERLACLPVEKLNETTPYREDTDIAFYTTDITPQEMLIGNGYFTIFFPHDAHMPQLCINKPLKVKKVVVKVATS